jgi:hypothetical protein
MIFRKTLVLCMGLLLLFPLLSATGDDGKTNKAGKELFQKMIDAVGGKENLAKINNYYAFQRVTQFLYDPERQNSFDAKNYIRFPDQIRYLVIMGKYYALITVDGGKGWIQSPLEYVFKPLGENDIATSLYTVQKDPVCLSRFNEKYAFELLGEREAAGKKTLALSITGLETFTLYIDPKTYLPVSATFTGTLIGTGKTDKINYEEIFSDYREVDGLKIPFNVVLNGNGKKTSEYVVKELKFNIPLEKDFFKKPLDKKLLEGTANAPKK